MRIMAAAALLLLLVSIAAAAAAAATSNTSDIRETSSLVGSEEEIRRILMEWEAEHGKWHGDDDDISSWVCNTERSVEETRRIMTEWAAEHGKTSSSVAEEEFRYRLCEVDRRWRNDGYPAWAWNKERGDEETRRIFVAWKAIHGKNYTSVVYEECRYAMFKDALRDVDRHNAGYAVGVHRNPRGIDSFTDLTHEEYEAVCYGYWPHDHPRPPAESRRLHEVLEQLWLEYVPIVELQ